MPEVRGPSLGNLIGNRVHNLAGGLSVGAGIVPTQLREMTANSPIPPGVELGGVDLGVPVEDTGTDDVLLNLADGLYMVDATYTASHSGAATFGYVRVDLSVNAVVFATAISPVSAELGVSTPATVFSWLVAGSFPLRAQGSHYFDDTTASEALTLRAVRVR